ncbi:ZC3H3 protein, partial [Sclerurus mexicanus]|nr:ZC3H3 protein [Sclerurus mexicanus]
SGSTSETAVTLKSEPQEPLELPAREPAGNSGWIKTEPPPTGHGCEEIRDASLHPKFPGNGAAPSVPAQLAVAPPGKSRFPVVPKVSALPSAASAPVSGKTPKFRKNNYTWEANPGKNSRLLKRWPSPRAESARKGLGMERGTKTPPKADSGAKGKKSGMPSQVRDSPNKYKWKASGLQALPSTSGSAFRWRSQDLGKAPALPVPPDPSAASGGAGKSFGEAALAGYKVRSRTKIIRRKGNGGFPPDKKSVSPGTALRSRFHLRRRNSARGKPSAATPKRSLSRIPAPISRPRLCGVPGTRTHGASREGSTFPFARSPPANKVIKTRYRIVKKTVMSPALSSFSSPIPTWKSRRPGTSR